MFETKDFKFAEWTFTQQNEVKYMKEYINESDIFWMKGVNKPIIIRRGIDKLMSAFNVRETDLKITIGEAGKDHQVLVSAILYLQDKDGNSFLGDGEASSKNTEGIAWNFPQAMAVKRARSRAILNHLHIDAYSEDEASDFAKNKPVSDDSLDEETLNNLGEKFSKKALISSIISTGAALSPKLEGPTLKNFILEVLGLDSDFKLTVPNLSVADLIKVLLALEISKSLGAEVLARYLENS